MDEVAPSRSEVRERISDAIEVGAAPSSLVSDAISEVTEPTRDVREPMVEPTDVGSTVAVGSTVEEAEEVTSVGSAVAVPTTEVAEAVPLAMSLMDGCGCG